MKDILITMDSKLVEVETSETSLCPKCKKYGYRFDNHISKMACNNTGCLFRGPRLRWPDKYDLAKVLFKMQERLSELPLAGEGE